MILSIKLSFDERANKLKNSLLDFVLFLRINTWTHISSFQISTSRPQPSPSGRNYWLYRTSFDCQARCGMFFHPSHFCSKPCFEAIYDSLRLPVLCQVVTGDCRSGVKKSARYYASLLWWRKTPRVASFLRRRKAAGFPCRSNKRYVFAASLFSPNPVRAVWEAR